MNFTAPSPCSRRGQGEVEKSYIFAYEYKIASMRLKRLLVLTLIIASVNAFAQKANLPLVKSPTGDSANSYSKTIGDAFIGLGFVLGGYSTGAQINYGQSREFIVGGGIGRRWIKWNGIGIDIYYKSTGYYLAQDSGKILPNSTLHKSEKISFDNIGGLAYDRFYLGTFFVDAGFYFDWAFYSKHITWDSYPGSYGGTDKVIEKQLDFVNNTNYGLTFRGGKTNGVSLYFNYRLSKVFKGASSNYPAFPQLPVYTLGIIVGLHA